MIHLIPIDLSSAINPEVFGGITDSPVQETGQSVVVLGEGEIEFGLLLEKMIQDEIVEGALPRVMRDCQLEGFHALRGF